MEKQVSEGSLHKWFKGSKSKDGKGGWVNVVTGGTCASDEPGEGTPKCVSSAKRASMTKAERLSAARRKKKADPNQQQKSGAAKPTYVSTDKKKMKETYERSLIPLSEKAQKCWKGYEKKGTKKMFGKTYNNCVKKEEVEVYNESIPLETRGKPTKPKKPTGEPVPVYGPGPGQREPKTDKPDIPSLPSDGPKKPIPPIIRRPSPSPKPTGQDLPAPLRKPIATLDRARKGDGYLGPTIRAGGKRFGIPNPFDRPKRNPSYGPGPGDSRRLPDDGPRKPLPKPLPPTGKPSPKPTPLPAPMPGDKPDTGNKKPVPMPEYKPDTGGKKPVPMPQYKPDIPGNRKPAPMPDPKFKLLRKEETEIQESDKKGKGSGTKDACYRKVKSRYSVWPSAYASGALVKCRKVGAANWGNSSKKEAFSDWKSEFIWEDGDSSKKIEEASSPAWQRKEGKSESGGLNAKGVASYRRENPGSKLKTAVTAKPSSLKRGSKDAKRRKSFCSRMRGMKKKLTSAKTARDPNSRINKSLRKWNC